MTSILTPGLKTDLREPKNLMTEHYQFIQSILAAPDIDLPRLVYADWLDENGESERAEFIRRQIAGLVSPVRLTWVTRYESFLDCQPHQALFASSVAGEAMPAESTVTSKHDLTRQRRITFRRGFVTELRGPLAAFWGTPCPNSDARVMGDRHQVYHFGGPESEWDDCPTCNGTGRVSGPTPTLMRLVGEQPVERVRVTDREPMRVQGGWTWVLITGDRDSRAEIPALIPINTSSGYFPDPDSAHAALSDALLTLARERCDPPHPLSPRQVTT